MMNTKEGNILSFKILVDSKGNLMTELSRLPLEDVHKVFAGEDSRRFLDEVVVHAELISKYSEKLIQSQRIDIRSVK